MHDSRAGDRTPVHYTVRTHTIPSPAPITSHSHSLSQSSRTGKTGMSTTPASSPRASHSVGQNHPPKLSPLRPDMRPPSPNYFGLVVDSSHDPRDSSGLGNNWSPASSSVKSFAAALPRPIEATNPDFEAFRRQIDINRGGRSFALPTSHYVQPTSNPALTRPRVPRAHTHASDTGSENSFPRLSLPRDRPSSRMDVDQDSLHDSAYLTNLPRFESPMPMDPMQSQATPARSENTTTQLTMTEHRPQPPSPNPPLTPLTRAATMPIKLEPGQPSLITAETLKDLLEAEDEDDILLLDIRSSTNYATSRIQGALNLCIPTTLLKRNTYNTEKLQQTFQDSSAGDKFATWKDVERIIVYDSHSSDARDTVAAQNMIKKFTNEKYLGETAILRGGFQKFQSLFPSFVDKSSTVPVNPDGGGFPGAMRGLAPVIGGVSLPTSMNPFFSNIRQNMDLADGVGQLDVAWPHGLESDVLPLWLRDAAAPQDHGKRVSDFFLRIEMEEKTPMNGRVQLSGVEKGGKNRYKDILPFEHARVKLQDKPLGACDYINASHLSASRSNKKYIASQGPLPATFEDFWSVIWEQDVRVIVMLTAESEGGQLKCHTYWKDREYGPIKLKQLSEKKASLDLDKHRSAATQTSNASSRKPTPQEQSEPTFVTIRKFALTHSSHPFAPIREITHLHFSSWPDFGTPAQPSHLLALVELANVMQRAALPVETASIMGSSKIANDIASIQWYDEPEADSASRPMLVHCSAGCGRTGAFCTVDSVIDMMKRQRLAKLPGGQPNAREAEEDTQMMDFDEAISPMTNREMSFKFNTDHEMGFKFNTDPEPRPQDAGVEHSSVDGSWVRDDSVDLIQKTVEDFREQRLSMVQSLRQYVLCYETVLEWVHRLHDRGAGASAGKRPRSESYQFS
ncbi:protein-tyrosine phosphatase domain-containing protein [Trichoderma breve]|uniref:protein-tyrosine-phosphatase n=1 Tax=Trichoderma breve TaxID=2034170 RepID=A0A9W9E5V9_9HYPO|nr:protein-tyrosine phosphatase domain-containing protein [Trichoderma breve]KAJ4857707.1 protein-tyrosine phosphatase domain-containing protein [Trichoderma breve]